jgi:thiamine-phosphate pyrophosphorylase
VQSVSRGLYPIVDIDALSARGLSPLSFAEAVLSARPPLLQLRNKSGSARDSLALLRALVPLCRRVGTLLFANDRPDLALLAGADGVHLGQSDLPIGAARRLAPALLVGLSTHSLPELDEALGERPSYVAFGPVFDTGSKRNPERVVGLDALSEAGARARAAGVPLVAIGGLDLARAALVAPHAELGAVIAALADEPDAIGERALRFQAVLSAGPLSGRAS